MNHKQTFKEDDPWNGHRLLSALAELLAEESSARWKNCTDFIPKTHQQRVYSVLCAAFDLKYDDSKMSQVIGSFADGEYVHNVKNNEESHDLLCKALCRYSGYDSTKVRGILSGNDCRYVFKELLNSRTASEKFSRRYSDLLEGTAGHDLACKVSGSLYSGMSDADKEIEKMLLALLGERGGFSLPVQKLIEYYRYPTTTDKELMDYLIDNC